MNPERSDLKTTLLKGDDRAGYAQVSEAPKEDDQLYTRKSTFGQDSNYSRKNTFARGYTFDAAFDTVTQPIEDLGTNISRKISDVGNRLDPDALFTKSVIREYVKHNEEGNEGDLPLPTGFARKKKFWKLIILVSLIAAFIGLAACGFMNFVDKIPEQWATCDFSEDPDCGQWYAGDKRWILVTAGGGLLVGLIRFFTNYPENGLPGIFKEIETYHVDPYWAPVSFIISGVSLGFGATLGPEQAMGNLGGGLATYISEHVVIEDPDYKKLLVLSGIGSAISCIFPSPVLGALMMQELGDTPKGFMESTTILSIGGIIAFVIYYEMVGPTYLDHLGTSYTLTAAWDYNSWNVITGFIIGVVSAGICLGILLFLGIVKQLFMRLRARLAFSRFLRDVIPPIIGGICIGTVNWALPLTVGNGNLVITAVVRYGASGDFSQNLLVCTCVARIFNLAVSMNAGYVGGIIFPFMSIGLIAGVVCYVNYEYVPYGLALGAFFVAVPCGITPAPFTFAGLSFFIFFFGLYQTVPIFVAVLTSYILICGSGLFKKLAMRAVKPPGEASEADKHQEVVATALNREKELAKVEADNFSVNHYLSNKSRVSRVSESDHERDSASVTTRGSQV